MIRREEGWGLDCNFVDGSAGFCTNRWVFAVSTLLGEGGWEDRQEACLTCIGRSLHGFVSEALDKSFTFHVWVMGAMEMFGIQHYVQSTKNEVTVYHAALLRRAE